MIQKEFYYVDKTPMIKDLLDNKTKSDEAIRQIEDKKYDMELRNNGYKYISYYGIAFCGKECVVHCKPYCNSLI